MSTEANANSEPAQPLGLASTDLLGGRDFLRRLRHAAGRWRPGLRGCAPRPARPSGWKDGTTDERKTAGGAVQIPSEQRRAR